MRLASCGFRHKVFVRNESHVGVFCKLLHVHLTQCCCQCKTILLPLKIYSSQSHSTFQLLLHLLKVDKLAVILDCLRLRSFSFVTVDLVLARLQTLARLEVLSHTVSACSC